MTFSPFHLISHLHSGDSAFEMRQNKYKAKDLLKIANELNSSGREWETDIYIYIDRDRDRVTFHFFMTILCDYLASKCYDYVAAINCDSFKILFNFETDLPLALWAMSENLLEYYHKLVLFYARLTFGLNLKCPWNAMKQIDIKWNCEAMTKKS